MYEKISGGMPFNVTVPNPAAGANFVYGLPVNFLYVPVSINFLLVTAVAVATRIVLLEFTDTNLLVRNTALNTIAASLTRRCQFSANRGSAGFTVSSGVEMAMCYPVQLIGGTADIQSNVLALQAADQISDITIQCQHWPNVPSW